MKIGIVGWGVEGQSAYRFLGHEHDYLIVNEEPQDNFPPESARLKVQFIKSQREPGLTGNVSDLSYLDGIDKCDRIIYSVTSAKNLEKKFGGGADFWAKATTIQHLFFEEVKTKNIIGVTGTKGKGTTSTLIYELLQAIGKKAWLGGNIGTAVLDFVREVQPDDWVVLELSNFQLYNLTYSPRVAVCLMIVPEHLDWHPDMADYLEAKANLFRHQKLEDIAIYFAGSEYSAKIAGYSPGHKIPYWQPPGARVREDGMIVVEDMPVMDRDGVKLLGEHNLQNICAAVTAVWFSLSEAEGQVKIEAMRQVLASFSGLEHRLELVRELDGVKYYDDSFATTPETTLVALRALPGSKVLIVGGHDKGADYEALADQLLKADIRHVITLGQVGQRIAERLKSRGFNSVTENLTDMQSIVAAARAKARLGDAVLLSCGTSSFGLFKDYKDRGNQFKQAVQELA